MEEKCKRIQGNDFSDPLCVSYCYHLAAGVADKYACMGVWCE